MEPRIVYKINWFFGNLIIYIPGYFLDHHANRSKFNSYELIFIFILASNNLDLLLLQLDRFLAVHWNLLYTDRIQNIYYSVFVSIVCIATKD